MDKQAIIQRILELAAASPLRHMFERMPWWNNWDMISEPGLHKVLETLEWQRSEIETLVEDTIANNPEARSEAYAYTHHAQMVDVQKSEALQSGDNGATESLLSTI